MTNRIIGSMPGELRKVVALRGITLLREEPNLSATIETQVLYGETLGIRAQIGEWFEAIVEFSGFCHIGYVRQEDVGDAPLGATHKVKDHLAQTLSSPGLKALHIDTLSKGSLLRVIGETEDHYQLWPHRWIFKTHVTPIGGVAAGDVVSTIESFLGVPYIWGGRSTVGMDCAGMIQLGLSFCGMESPRAMTDMAENLGRALDPDEAVRSGDFVFYSAHCGMYLDEERVIHAAGKAGLVSIEERSSLHHRMTEVRGYPLIARRRVRE